ncbi:efflux RND transporter periplasmic adaptor subunit [Ekhidna sp. MALMAid0563]|uniref:efflux RND transporter periplasmic adaptor subunit n=1 Tax=Ekhidna sp. MALMAid0563 TaxID=3143937 RepID=UPI0032DE3997
MKKYIIIILILLVASCKQGADVTSDDMTYDGLMLTKEQQEKAGITTTKLKIVDIPQYISVRGVVDVPPSHRASISVFHGGYVSDLDLLPGKAVNKGDLLFTLQNPAYIDMQQAYLEVKERIEFLKADYERQKTLASEAISSEKKYKQAESDYLVAKAKLESLKEQLKLININLDELENGKVISTVAVYAPISGFVSDLVINKGSFLAPQDVAMQIVNTDHVHLELTVYEKDITAVQKGQKIKFRTDDSDSLLLGEVHLIEKSIDLEKRSVQVHGHLPATYPQLVVGAYIDAMIETGIKKNYALPVDAIVDLDGAQFIAVKSTTTEGDFFEKVSVETGLKTGNWVEVMEPGELLNKEIVITGAYEAIN